jgi:hypothetical protein
MSEDERGRSPDLDRLRQILFPALPPDEGRRRIESAIEGASDEERWSRIEELAGRDLSGDLLAVLRRLLQERPPANEEE